MIAYLSSPLLRELGTNLPQSQPLVKDFQFGVSPVNYSDSDSDWKFQDHPLREGYEFLNFVINNDRICMGFKADRVEKVQKLAYLKRFSEKCLIKKLLLSKC